MPDSTAEDTESTQKNGTETDEQRKERTGLSSLKMDDDASKAVQKTSNRVALAQLEARISGEEFIHPASIPHMTICVLTVENGFALVGKAAPADAANFDRDLGHKFAREDAMRQLWPLEAYLLREQLWRQEDFEN